MSQPGTRTTQQRVEFLWLEITGKCQLQCVHCYAESSPSGSHGAMTLADWLRVITQAKELGVAMVQFIGGEPTMHPDFFTLARHALSLGLEVEVYSNLMLVTEKQWELFGMPGVRLATSYYSADAAQHEAITGRARSYERTKANIAEVVRRSIPLRVGMIGVVEGQQVDQARAELQQMGVTDIGYDQLRQVGRGIRDLQASAEQLCGNCAGGVMAISASGEVWPCVFSRWLPIGNMLTQSLAQVVYGPARAETRAALQEEFAKRNPDMCNPCTPGCNPGWCMPGDGTGCRPPGKVGAQDAQHQRAGNPSADCNPCGPNCSPSWDGRNTEQPAACNPCTPNCSPSCNPACNPNCPPMCNPMCAPSDDNHRAHQKTVVPAGASVYAAHS